MVRGERREDKYICVIYKMDYDYVFSYQGAFGPPTYGHYKSMEAFANQLNIDFLGKKILMLFMPTGGGGSKPHLQPTRSMRKSVLDMFCEKLQENFTNVIFVTSEIEYNIFDAEKTKGKTATIHTINELKIKYPTSSICLGMGLDNAYQLPYWESIDKYSDLVHKIYVVPRTPSADELSNTRIFNLVENPDNSVTEMRFDVNVPWTNETFLNCFLPPSNQRVIIEKGDKDALINALEDNKALSDNDKTEPYMFYQKLPPVVVLAKSSIPATSSSMMRYFIGQYLQDNEEENNLIKKIGKLMFGNDTLTGPQKEIVINTINNYNDVFNETYPGDKDYETQYNSITFPGGNRKTKKRRSHKKRRRSHKNKRRSRKI